MCSANIIFNNEFYYVNRKGAPLGCYNNILEFNDRTYIVTNNNFVVKKNTTNIKFGLWFDMLVLKHTQFIITQTTTNKNIKSILKTELYFFISTMKAIIDKSGVHAPDARAFAKYAQFEIDVYDPSKRGGSAIKKQTVKNYSQNGNNYVFPRMCATRALNQAGYVIEGRFPPGDDIDFDTQISLKPYQQTIYDHIMKKMTPDKAELGVASCLLDLKPGYGKTFISLAVMETLKKRTLYIVPSCQLLVQISTLLKEMYPSVGVYYGKEKTFGEIVVMTASSASGTHFELDGQTVKADEYMLKFGLTILDEAHEYCNNTGVKIFRQALSKYTLGLSGTNFDRVDGMNPLSHHWIGLPLIASQLVDLSKAVEPWRFQSYCIRYNGPEEYTKSLTSEAGTVSHPRMVTQFNCDPYRAQILVNLLTKIKSKCFIFIDRVEAVQLIHDYILSHFPPVDNHPIVNIIMGNSKPSQRENARRSQFIIGTYDCIGTGISYDEFTSCIFYNPRLNGFKQYLARIFREGGDRSQIREAWFFQDNATSIKSNYQGFYKCCLSQYDTRPEVITIDYEDVEPTEEIITLAKAFQTAML